MLKPFISICIPAYKRVDYLKRLFQSISIQTYKNFEVVVTDDSGNDNTVENFINLNSFNFKLVYIKNPSSLGSPLNWLESFKHAQGDWIKIMHDDDYFISDTSLSKYVNGIDSKADCIFSGYIVEDEVNKSKKEMVITDSTFNRFLNKPLRLFAKNKIGPPTVMLFKRSITDTFDSRLKWIVDWEFYIRLALKYNIKYINSPLVVVSYNDTQITNSCALNPMVEIPEIMVLYSKYGDLLFKDIVLFDAWWRLIRNLKIKNREQFSLYTSLPIPKSVVNIISFQSVLTYNVLKIGVISKFYMTCCFVYNRLFSL
jgi:glycosyltransferase involved in cell wall biosynthesis